MLQNPLLRIGCTKQQQIASVKGSKVAPEAKEASWLTDFFGTVWHKISLDALLIVMIIKWVDPLDCV